MTFEKGGTRWVVTDPAHIDCLRAKGWHEVHEVIAGKQSGNSEEKRKK